MPRIKNRFDLLTGRKGRKELVPPPVRDNYYKTLPQPKAKPPSTRRNRYDIAMNRQGRVLPPMPPIYMPPIYVESELSDYSKRMIIRLQVSPAAIDTRPEVLFVMIVDSIANEIKRQGWDQAPFYMSTDGAMIRSALSMTAREDGGVSIIWSSDPRPITTVAQMQEEAQRYTLNFDYLQPGRVENGSTQLTVPYLQDLARAVGRGTYLGRGIQRAAFDRLTGERM